MRSFEGTCWVVALIAIVAAAGLPDPALAQLAPERLFKAGAVTFGVAGGGAAYTAFQRGQAHAAGRDFDRRLSAQTSVALSATLTYWISGVFAVRAHGSYSPTRFVMSMPDEDAALFRAAEPDPLASLGVLMADADVLLRAPVIFGRIAPYGIIGAGVVDYRADPGSSSPLPVEAREAFASGSQRRFAGVIGVGALVPLERHDFFLTFELTNHMTRSPVAHTATSPTPSGAQTLVDADAWSNDEGEAGHTSAVRLMVGLTVPLAR
ncbi:MAG: hypothetical protein ACRELX_05860 [Longimicrobiales bacterium]